MNQNLNQATLSLQLFTRDLRLTASEREQLNGLVQQLASVAEIELRKQEQAHKEATVPYARRNGDPDKEIASGDSEDRVPIAIPASRP